MVAVLEICAVVAIVSGVMMWSVPAGLIVSGLALYVFALGIEEDRR